SEPYVEHFGKTLLAARSDREREAVVHPLDPAKFEGALGNDGAEGAGNVRPAFRPVQVAGNGSSFFSVSDLNAEVAQTALALRCEFTPVNAFQYVAVVNIPVGSCALGEGHAPLPHQGVRQGNAQSAREVVKAGPRGPHRLIILGR